MQIIRKMEMTANDYLSQSVQENVEPPSECPHCKQAGSLEALGYYSRYVTSPENGVLRISVRRFRCCSCGRTASVLPSFVQPYRLVANPTINNFFEGSLGAKELSWLPLLKQYWKRFSDWLPRVRGIISSVVTRSPPLSDPSSWWQALTESLVNIEGITAVLVGDFRITLFGRYRCHTPNSGWRESS